MAIVAGLMLPAVVGCLMPSAARAQTMECCAQSACARSHQKQTCFSTTAPTGNLQSNPELRVSVMAPSVSTDACVPSQARKAAAFAEAAVASVPKHSPPELYTLHLALLI